MHLSKPIGEIRFDASSHARDDLIDKMKSSVGKYNQEMMHAVDEDDNSGKHDTFLSCNDENDFNEAES
jgi:hypothetical protein